MASSEARKNPPPVPKKRFHERPPPPPGAAEARASLEQSGARRRSDLARQAARLQAAVSDRPPPQDPGVHAASVPPPPPSAVSAVAGSIAPATLKATAVDARAEEAKRRRLGLVAAAALLLAVSGTVAVLDTGLQPGAPAASRAARVVAPPAPAPAPAAPEEVAATPQRLSVPAASAPPAVFLDVDAELRTRDSQPQPQAEPKAPPTSLPASTLTEAPAAPVRPAAPQAAAPSELPEPEAAEATLPEAEEAPDALPAFDRDAAKSALDVAAVQAAACGSTPDAQTVRVGVTFAPSGRATTALIEGNTPLKGTTIGSCIARAMRTAQVPAFDGGLVTVHTRVWLR